jgi:hypothetical protein
MREKKEREKGLTHFKDGVRLGRSLPSDYGINVRMTREDHFYISSLALEFKLSFKDTVTKILEEYRWLKK